MYVQRVCACSCACLYVCVLYCVCPYIVLQYKKLRFKLSRAQPAQATVRQMRCCAFPCARKSYANGPALFVFPRAGSSLPPPRQICRPTATRSQGLSAPLPRRERGR